MTFAELIETARAYLGVFDFDHYPDCFRRFEADAKPLFDALSEDGGQEEASSLVAELARRRASLHRRACRDAAYEQKQVLCLFLSPAALRHSKAAQAFSERLRSLWCEQQPRNTYLSGSYEQIMKGFDANLLGLPLRKSRKR